MSEPVQVRCTCQTVTGGGLFSPPERPCRMHGVGWSDPGGPRGVVIPPPEPNVVYHGTKQPPHARSPRMREPVEACVVAGCGWDARGTAGGAGRQACGGMGGAAPCLISYYAEWDPEDRPPYRPDLPEPSAVEPGSQDVVIETGPLEFERTGTDSWNVRQRVRFAEPSAVEPGKVDLAAFNDPDLTTVFAEMLHQAATDTVEQRKALAARMAAVVATLPEPSTVEPGRCGHGLPSRLRTEWQHTEGDGWEPCPSAIEQGRCLCGGTMVIRHGPDGCGPIKQWPSRPAPSETSTLTNDLESGLRVEPGSQDEALIYQGERGGPLEQALASRLAAARADVDREKVAHAITAGELEARVEWLRVAEAENAVLRADVDRLTAQVDEYAWQRTQAFNERDVLRGQRDAALALADELAAAGALAGSRGHYEVRADALTAAREIRRALGVV